jgi:hypothetical protein
MAPIMKVDGNDILDRFVTKIGLEATSADAYRGHRAEWTEIATSALVSVARDITHSICTYAAKGAKTAHGRSEHLTIDVLAYDKDYGPIQFAAEHENTLRPEQICYCAWKLLQLRNPIRVLVAYWDSENAHADRPRSIDDVRDAITKNVFTSHDAYSREEIILLAADTRALPSPGSDWGTIFTVRHIQFPAQQ